MGTTNEIKETNIGQALIGKTCQGCGKKFTEKEICEENNWEVEFDTSNDVKLEDNQIKGYGYNLTIWIRQVYHEDCDKAEEEWTKRKIEERKKVVAKTGIRSEVIDAVMGNLMEGQKRQVEILKKEKQYDSK